MQNNAQYRHRSLSCPKNPYGKCTHVEQYPQTDTISAAAVGRTEAGVRRGESVLADIELLHLAAGDIIWLILAS